MADDPARGVEFIEVETPVAAEDLAEGLGVGTRALDTGDEHASGVRRAQEAIGSGLLGIELLALLDQHETEPVGVGRKARQAEACRDGDRDRDRLIAVAQRERARAVLVQVVCDLDRSPGEGERGLVQRAEVVEGGRGLLVGAGDPLHKSRDADDEDREAACGQDEEGKAGSARGGGNQCPPPAGAGSAGVCSGACSMPGAGLWAGSL